MFERLELAIQGMTVVNALAPTEMTAIDSTRNYDRLRFFARYELVKPRFVADASNVSPISGLAADAAMERYASGDATAFGDLYDALTPRLYGFILRIVRDRGRAEDLVQQTMLQMHCAKASFVMGSRVTPWAFAIIRRLFLDQRRRKELELLGLDEGTALQQPSSHPGPEESAQSRELRRLVRRELSRLSPAQRAAVELVYYRQMSHAEAAEALGVTVASIKLRVQRASQAMRAALDASGDGSQ